MIEIFNGFWSREYVANNKHKIFIFGDNTYDRTVTKYVPKTTQAVIRGLPNAFGIDTKRNRWDAYITDEMFDAYKIYLDDVFVQLDQLNINHIIVFPKNGIGTGKAMLEIKAPKCFKYLQKKITTLYERHTI